MFLVQKKPLETISKNEGSTINGILRELITLSAAQIVLLVRTDGALIARAGNMQANDIEALGALSALMYGAAQSIAASIHTSLSYVHQHGGQKDLLLVRINETVGLIIAYNQDLGLGGILYNARRCAVALGQILGT